MGKCQHFCWYTPRGNDIDRSIFSPDLSWIGGQPSPGILSILVQDLKSAENSARLKDNFPVMFVYYSLNFPNILLFKIPDKSKLIFSRKFLYITVVKDEFLVMFLKFTSKYENICLISIKIRANINQKIYVYVVNRGHEKHHRVHGLIYSYVYILQMVMYWHATLYSIQAIWYWYTTLYSIPANWFQMSCVSFHRYLRKFAHCWKRNLQWYLFVADFINFASCL